MGPEEQRVPAKTRKSSQGTVPRGERVVAEGEGVCPERMQRYRMYQNTELHRGFAEGWDDQIRRMGMWETLTTSHIV